MRDSSPGTTQEQPQHLDGGPSHTPVQPRLCTFQVMTRLDIRHHARIPIVRMAIGQLFDYRRFEPAPVELGVLVPVRPADDLLDLLEDLGIACVWASDDGFEDSRGGEFV